MERATGNVMNRKEKLQEYGFDVEAYEKAKKYDRENLILNVAGSAISLGALVAFAFLGSGPFYELLESLIGNRWGIRVAYIVVFSLGFFLLDLPTGWLSYKVEKKYELSNQGLTSWLSDRLKSLGISLGLSLIGFILLFWLIDISEIWWIWVWLSTTAITIFIQFIAPTVLMPLFYDFEPIEEEGLKEKLEDLAGRAGLDILGVFNMKASEKTSKGIGGLTGIGSSRRIILSDTMLDNYSEEEIEAVMAHEMGHHKYNDIWILLLIQSLFSLLGFFLIATFFESIISGFGLQPNVSTLPVILGSMELFLFLLSPLQNSLSRARERMADRFSLQLIDNPEALGEALVKLSRQNLGNPAPPKWVEWLFQDHPSSLSRVERAFDYGSSQGD
ncbi:MAG: M48 family metallopeptidase [Candidatus Acetothermia bacterium]